jgi:hypothetical protein
MPPTTRIATSEPSRLVGPLEAPAIGSSRRDYRTISQWGPGVPRQAGRCGLPEGREDTAPWLRNDGVLAEELEGGFKRRTKSGELLVRIDNVPVGNGKGRTPIGMTPAPDRSEQPRLDCPLTPSTPLSGAGAMALGVPTFPEKDLTGDRNLLRRSGRFCPRPSSDQPREQRKHHHRCHPLAHEPRAATGIWMRGLRIKS